MKSYLPLIFFLLSFSVSAQQRVILDADIDSDVDDVEALAMLHTLQKEKEILLLGVIVTSDDPYAATCVSAVNHYYGQANLPIGFLKNQTALKNHSKYTRQLSTEFPHLLKSYEEAEDAVSLYRKLLSQSPDNSVTILSIGHLSSLQALLKSGSDQNSNLSGIALVNQKVNRWICMGGQFPEGKEANFYRPDPQSTVYSLQVFPKPMLFCGWEMGEKVITGGKMLQKNLKPQNPVYRAYQLYNNFAGRPSWDQVAVLALSKKSKKYFDTIKTGYCLVNADGSNSWLFEPDSQQEYLIFKQNNPGVHHSLAKLIDKMVLE